MLWTVRQDLKSQILRNALYNRCGLLLVAIFAHRTTRYIQPKPCPRNGFCIALSNSCCHPNNLQDPVGSLVGFWTKEALWKIVLTSSPPMKPAINGKRSTIKKNALVKKMPWRGKPLRMKRKPTNTTNIKIPVAVEIQTERVCGIMIAANSTPNTM